MGVSGSGKTSIGKLLAKKTGYLFYDADNFHPQQNIEKMKAGEALTDEDRSPWLLHINQFVIEAIRSHSIIFACSALKASYRKLLSRQIASRCHWVFLQGSFETIQQRMQQRKDHYMPASLLQSQFDALEIPTGAITVDINLSPEVMVNQILSSLQ
jgi:carbohydrate kinase (thermoresistant glucokinase family)